MHLISACTQLFLLLRMPLFHEGLLLLLVNRKIVDYLSFPFFLVHFQKRVYVLQEPVNCKKAEAQKLLFH